MLRRIIRLLKDIPSLRIYVGLIIALAVMLALTVTFTKDLSDYVAGTLTGLFTALIGVLFILLYEEATRENARRRKRNGFLRGIHVELTESLEYLKTKPNPKQLNFIPPFPRTAWDMACASGEINLTDELSHRLTYIYGALQNYNFLTKEAIDIYWMSRNPTNQKNDIVDFLIYGAQKIYESLKPIAEKAKSDLEVKLGISSDEVASLGEKIRTRIVVPPLPHAFYGMVQINDSPAPIGTKVEARGAGVLTSSSGNPIIATKVGEYGSKEPLGSKLVVQGNIVEGTTITFHVNDVPAGQKASWHSGKVTQLDLTVNIN